MPLRGQRLNDKLKIEKFLGNMRSLVSSNDMNAKCDYLSALFDSFEFLSLVPSQGEASQIDQLFFQLSWRPIEIVYISHKQILDLT